MQKVTMKRMVSVIGLLVLLLSSGQVQAKVKGNEWTAFFKVDFNAAQALRNRERSALHLLKETVMPFNQLIFTWNAERPTQGYFIFKVQIYSAKNKQWSQWHTMSEWGTGVQRSYLSKMPDGTTNFHVRLHTPEGEYATGFKIRIESAEGASLELIKSIGVTISDLSKAPSPTSFIGDIHSYKAVRIKNIPAYSQMILNHEKANVICSPTACSMLVSYLIGHPIDAATFANQAYDTGLEAYGSWPFNTAHAFECCKGTHSFHVKRIDTFKTLYQFLNAKIPVVVSVRGAIAGAPKEYPHGHLLLIVGVDPLQRKVMCHDPAQPTDDAVFTAYDMDSFIAAWARSHYLAYVAAPLNK
jgi:hypothetical protein